MRRPLIYAICNISTLNNLNAHLSTAAGVNCKVIIHMNEKLNTLNAQIGPCKGNMKILAK